MDDDDIIARIDAYCDAVPRQRARAEEIGSLVLFVPVGASHPYYARPRALPRGPVSATDVLSVRERQRELLIPESFEWIKQAAPEMATAAAAAGLRVHAHPLLVLAELAPPPDLPPHVSADVLGADDPDVVHAWAVPAVAFGNPGTAIGRATVTERDRITASHDPLIVEALRERLRAGQSVLAAARGPNGPLGAGSYQMAGDVAEITGVGVLPASRRRGLGAAVTHVLAAHALARGAVTVFLSASDAVVARVYGRLGLREVGTSMIAEPAGG